MAKTSLSEGGTPKTRRGGFLLFSMVLAGLSFAAHAKDIPTLHVGWTIPAEEAKYWMMRRPDAFPDLGKTYKIEWTHFQGTAPMVEAMLAGALDCSSQAPLSLGQGAVNGGLKAYIVAQHAGESAKSFSVYWGVLDGSPIKTVEDLKGKTIGVNVYGSGVAGQLAAILHKHGLDMSKDVKLVETGFPGSEAALRSGRVDAAVFVQPFAGRAQAKGGIHSLFSMQDLMPNTVQIVEVCRKDIADKSPALIKRYVRDLTRAMKMALAHRDETLKVDAEITHAPVAALQDYLLTDKDFARDPGAHPDFAAIQTMFDEYAKLGLLKHPLKVSDFRRNDLTAPLQ
ncbi:MAG: ABC transporter substrate-binding protein [Bordetella sp.]|uniref:ABC transporter substrate-binding protein n=1 Tax=Bordetella sp. TaxID=28081 RepID=UPI003F7C1458